MTSPVHVVTRCLRSDPACIYRVSDSLVKNLRVPFTWVLVGPNAGLPSSVKALALPCECEPGDYCGLLNHYLDVVPDTGQWVYVLDDDNLIHPGFNSVYDHLNDDCVLFVGSQQLTPNQVRVAAAHNLVVQQVDSAQYCIKRSLIGDLRHWNCYRHDGYFLMELNIRAREQGLKVQVFPQVVSYYNAQHWL